VPKKNKNDEELDLLMSFLAESVAQMSDDQIKEEFGADPKPRTKEILKAALKDCHKQKLREARVEYESAAKGFSSRSYDLPSGEGERRALLSSILSRRSELRSLAFTAQHRELKDLSDADVESFLRQLADLGLLASFLE
jgi:hypothetical protein